MMMTIIASSVHFNISKTVMKKDDATDCAAMRTENIAHCVSTYLHFSFELLTVTNSGF